MKRLVILCLISAAFVYNIIPQPDGVPQIDQIKTKMAAARARPDDKQTAIHHVSASLVGEENNRSISTVSDSAITEELAPDSSELAHTDEIPWEDIKQGWRSDLKDFLVDADPENGEEIYTSYMEETESFEAEVDALSKEADKAGKDARQDFETLIGQLEVKHEEKLKEILGSHYSEVTDRHQQYNSSIQYMNRSDADIVGVSL